MEDYFLKNIRPNSVICMFSGFTLLDKSSSGPLFKSSVQGIASDLAFKE